MTHWGGNEHVVLRWSTSASLRTNLSNRDYKWASAATLVWEGDYYQGLKFLKNWGFHTTRLIAEASREWGEFRMNSGWEGQWVQLWLKTGFKDGGGSLPTNFSPLGFSSERGPLEPWRHCSLSVYEEWIYDRHRDVLFGYCFNKRPFCIPGRSVLGGQPSTVNTFKSASGPEWRPHSSWGASSQWLIKTVLQGPTNLSQCGTLTSAPSSFLPFLFTFSHS